MHLRKRFPLDYIGLEPGWQSKAYPGTFEWDKKRYPDPKKFVKEMLDKGIRLNLMDQSLCFKRSTVL
jgi:alpha-glucosidase (family GH31 glycosyl hydrolase)